MNKNRLLIVVLVVLITLSIAHAQSFGDDFATFAEPIGEILESYMKNEYVSLVVDLIMYIWLFTSFVPEQLKKRWGDGSAKTAKVIGAILAISMMGAEYMIGFRLIQFWPVAAGLIVILILDSITGGREELQKFINPIRLGILFLAISYLLDVLGEFYDLPVLRTATAMLHLFSWILLAFGIIHAILQAFDQGRAVAASTGSRLSGAVAGIGDFIGAPYKPRTKERGETKPGEGGEKKPGEGGEKKPGEGGETNKKTESATTPAPQNGELAEYIRKVMETNPKEFQKLLEILSQRDKK